jgi:hypothetical protein
MSEQEIESAKGSVWFRLTEGWHRWSSGSVNRSIFGAAVTIGALTIVVKSVAVVK